LLPTNYYLKGKIFYTFKLYLLSAANVYSIVKFYHNFQNLFHGYHRLHTVMIWYNRHLNESLHWDTYSCYYSMSILISIIPFIVYLILNDTSSILLVIHVQHHHQWSSYLISVQYCAIHNTIAIIRTLIYHNDMY